MLDHILEIFSLTFVSRASRGLGIVIRRPWSWYKGTMGKNHGVVDKERFVLIGF